MCNLCGKTFLKKDAYHRHVWSEHKVGKPKGNDCHICGKFIIGRPLYKKFLGLDNINSVMHGNELPKFMFKNF